MARESEADLPPSGERQLTSASYNHILTNIGAWSHDGQWIYYDVRTDLAGAQFDGQRIERVRVSSRQVEVVYQSRRSACCGVVTASPVDNQIVFIHGPENPSEDWAYAAWHRRGVIVQPGANKPAMNLDARDIVSPFTPGALRGGTHVHVFSGDGQWVSFTYEDHVLEVADLPGAQQNQRNVGVAAPFGPVAVRHGHPRNHDGAAFAVLVSRTTDRPQPGSDEISRAYSDAWIGKDGYVRHDGARQHRALAFIGNVVDRDGNVVPELFVVDIPDHVTRAGQQPLCGTEVTRPAPPKGTVQRRLTKTAERKKPGLAAVRHWPRSSPDGRRIAFLLCDDDGRTQLWTISPTGEQMRQLTRNEFSIESAFTWRPDGRALACVAGGRLCEVDAATGITSPLTAKDDTARPPRPEAVVYAPDGTSIAYVRTVESSEGAFNQIFIAELPPAQ